MMRERDYRRFTELMERAGELTVMPNGRDLGRTVKALFDELAAYPFEAVENAVRDHCRSERFFPMLADIVKRIEGDAPDRAAAAWALVLKAIRRHGHYESVCFPSPAIHYALAQMGGWRSLCATLTSENAPFRAKDFAQYYAVGERVASWKREPGKVQVPPYLQGEHEARNGTSGHSLPPRVYDAQTGELAGGKALPGPQAPRGKVRDIVQLVAGGMDARESVR